MSLRPIKTFIKDPDAVLDYSVDWSDWLEDDDDTISSVVWDVPTGLTLSSQSETDTVATVFLSGGTAATRYNVGCRVTTVGGRVDDRTIEIRVQEK